MLNNAKQIKLGAIISYAAILFNIIAGLIYTPWMVNQIGKSEYGLYVLVTSFLTYFVIDFGLGQTIARFIAQYKNVGEEWKINNLLGLTTKLYLIIDLFILFSLVIVFFFIEQIFLKLNEVEIQKFKIIFLIAGTFSLFSFPFSSLNGIMIAYGRFMMLKLADLISKISIISLMVIALLLGYKLYALIAINAFVGLTIIIIKLIYLSKTTNIIINLKFRDKNILKQVANFSIWITVIGIAQRLFINISPTLLGMLSGTEQIAFFAIASVLEGYTYTFAKALNGLFLPRVAELVYKTKNTKAISDLMIRVGRIQLMLIGILIIGLITLGKEFVGFWMGSEFVVSYYIMLLIVTPGIITLTQEIGGTMLFVVNEIKYRAILYFSAAIISIVISLIFIPSLGAIGSAIGIFCGLISSHIIGMNLVYSRILKLDIPRFFKEVHLDLLPTLAITFISGLLINKYMPAENLISFFLKAITLVLIYLLIIWFWGMNNYEKGLVRGITGKIRIQK